MNVEDRRDQSSALLLLAAVLLGALNVALVAFYVLYRAADEWAVDRSEMHGGFDPSYLLPHDMGLWVIATATVVLLVAVDVIAILVGLKLHVFTRKLAAR